MSTVGGTRRGPRRQLQDGSADKVVVNLEESPPAGCGLRRQLQDGSADKVVVNLEENPPGGRGPRRHLQDGSAGKVVVNLEDSPPAVGRRRVGPTAAAAAAPPPPPAPSGARTSPMNVVAIEDEVQLVSPSRVPPPRLRRNRRTRREHIVVIDLEVDAGQEVNKRPRGESSSLQGTSAIRVNLSESPGDTRSQPVSPSRRHQGAPQAAASPLPSNNAAHTSKEPEAPKEPLFTCPICWNVLKAASTTTCGHIFCSECIKKAIKGQKKCPTCRKKLKARSTHRIFFPNCAS
ncbi:hypothetical protein ACP4OV_024264 [Aristida adscensionis]